MEQLLERFVQLEHARVRHIQIHLAGSFLDLRIGNARHLGGVDVGFNAFRLHLAQKRRGITDLQF